MRKRILAVLLSALTLANVTACNVVQENKDNPTFENTEQTDTPKNLSIDVQETIARTKNYHFYKVEDTFELGCEFYNATGEIVFSERSQRPMTVSEIDADLIEIQIGYGTGTIGHRYYSIEKEQISDEFFDVVANHGGKIAYLNGELNDRKLIVQDIYQPVDSGHIFTLDFSPTIAPVTKAAFSEDGSTISLTYLAGQIYATKQAKINLE